MLAGCCGKGQREQCESSAPNAVGTRFSSWPPAGSGRGHQVQGGSRESGPLSGQRQTHESTMHEVVWPVKDRRSTSGSCSNPATAAALRHRRPPRQLPKTHYRKAFSKQQMQSIQPSALKEQSVGQESNHADADKVA